MLFINPFLLLTRYKLPFHHYHCHCVCICIYFCSCVCLCCGCCCSFIFQIATCTPSPVHSDKPIHVQSRWNNNPEMNNLRWNQQQPLSFNSFNSFFFLVLDITAYSTKVTKMAIGRHRKAGSRVPCGCLSLRVSFPTKCSDALIFHVSLQGKFSE